MNELPNLVTSYTFKEKQYIVKMTLDRNSESLELSVIDKYSAEEWRCSYDSSYIENLTHKTGNFKQFDIFVTMLKSGLLQTSECITLDLLTLQDLENLRKRRVMVNGNGTRFASRSQTLNSDRNLANRRYLILTYSVEFDRIHYPLPLEYVGPPNPHVLQGTIKRLEAEVDKLKSKLVNEGEKIDVEMWRDRIRELEAENYILMEEVAYLRQLLVKKTGCGSGPSSTKIPAVIKSLEEQVKRERASFKATLKGLQEQNHRLRQELEAAQATDASYIKQDAAYTGWKDRGQSPVACIHKFPSPRIEGESGAPSPGILGKNAAHKNEKWKDVLTRNGCRRKPLKTSCDHKCNIPQRNQFQGRERSSSGSSYHSRSSKNQDFSTKPKCTRINTQSKSASKRASSSSHCSEESQRGERKDSSIRKRTISRSSSLSDASLSSGSRSSIKSGKQSIQSKLSREPSPVVLRGYNQTSKTNFPRTQSKFSLKKDSFLNKETRAGISKLEARIKALQKLIREGISFP